MHEAPKFNLWGINYELRSRKRLPKGEITNYELYSPSRFLAPQSFDE
ncbi:hypothetical protein IQ247_20290 [Plectonema cf. radiosum LEGE 06105]|uniref:Uncharacterized protein n=1 Tax=Plectonema cf. radiosum LEGE 06105 TaxID=945769 RepID=A0A8J7F4L3_9CYAN|nr:hypothetical protein [Plectonema radiosum]MBE9214980.1 hypothetical protein [Plectonema cf. radiosum LEGE 06105]